MSFWGLRGALAGAGWCHRVPFLLAALMLEKAVLGGHRSQAAVPKVLVVTVGVDSRGSAGRWLGTFRNPFSRVFLKPPSLLSNWIVIPEPSPSPCARSGSQQSSQSLPVPWDVPKLAAPQKLLPSPSKTPTADFGPWEKHHHGLY